MITNIHSYFTFKWLHCLQRKGLHFLFIWSPTDGWTALIQQMINSSHACSTIILHCPEYCFFHGRNSVISATAHITSGSIKRSSHTQLLMNTFETLAIRQLQFHKLLPVHPLTILSSSICNHIYKTHVGDLDNSVTIHFVQSLCGEQWFKPAKHFNIAISTAPSNASTWHFGTYMLILNQIISVPSTCFCISARYFWNTLYVLKIKYFSRTKYLPTWT